MRLKDIFWPWGAVKECEQLGKDLAFTKLGLSSRREANNFNFVYLVRQYRIAANLRSECIRLHGEVERLNESLAYVQVAAVHGLSSHYRHAVYFGAGKAEKNTVRMPSAQDISNVYEMPGPIRGVVR